MKVWDEIDIELLDISQMLTDKDVLWCKTLSHHQFWTAAKLAGEKYLYMTPKNFESLRQRMYKMR